LRTDVAPQSALEGAVGMGGLEVLDHVGGDHKQSGVSGETGSMDDGLGDTRFAETGRSRHMMPTF